MQLFNLADDPAETVNLLSRHPERVQTLLNLLNLQVSRGRCTPGEAVANDRDVKFLPEGVSLPKQGKN